MLTRVGPSPWGEACVRETSFVPIGELVSGRALSPPALSRILGARPQTCAVEPMLLSVARPDHARTAAPDLVRSGKSDCTRGHESACCAFSRQEVPLLRLLS